jgi:hypothetical protein
MSCQRTPESYKILTHKKKKISEKMERFYFVVPVAGQY